MMSPTAIMLIVSFGLMEVSGLTYCLITGMSAEAMDVLPSWQAARGNKNETSRIKKLLLFNQVFFKAFNYSSAFIEIS